MRATDWHRIVADWQTGSAVNGEGTGEAES